MTNCAGTRVTMAKVEKRRVLRRKVFFIHGFDPREGQRYKDRYIAENQAQSAFVDYRLTITDLPEDQPKDRTWKTTWQKDGWPVTVTEFEALEWGDLVRSTMRGGVLSTLASARRSFSVLFRTGVFSALIRLDHFKAIAFLIPYIVLTFQFLVAAGIGLAGMSLVSGFGAPWGAWATAAVLFVMTFWLARQTRGFFMTSYSLSLYEFCVGQNGAYTPETEERLDHFRKKVMQALEQDFDEVVVIGHSFGANLALSTVSDVLRSDGRAGHGPRLTLVTLGAFLINMTLLPDAWRQRRDMQVVAGQETVAWFDLSAQADRYIFSLYDPVKASGVAPDPQIWPKIIPVRYRHNLQLKTYKTLRRSFFDTHLQYIQAFDRPRDYDYFALTAGPQFVRDYFARSKPEERGIGRVIGRYHSTSA